jgi:hypothetical protein
MIHSSYGRRSVRSGYTTVSLSPARTVHAMRTAVVQVVACNLYLSGQNDGEFMEAIPLSTRLRHKTIKTVLQYKQLGRAAERNTRANICTVM